MQLGGAAYSALGQVLLSACALWQSGRCRAFVRVLLGIELSIKCEKGIESIF